MPLIQITVGRHYTDEVARTLLAEISRVAHEVTGTPMAGVRAWIVEVPDTRLMAGGKTLAEIAGSASDAAVLLGQDPRDGS